MKEKVVLPKSGTQQIFNFRTLLGCSSPRGPQAGPTFLHYVQCAYIIQQQNRSSIYICVYMYKHVRMKSPNNKLYQNFMCITTIVSYRGAESETARMPRISFWNLYAHTILGFVIRHMITYVMYIMCTKEKNFLKVHQTRVSVFI